MPPETSLSGCGLPTLPPSLSLGDLPSQCAESSDSRTHTFSLSLSPSLPISLYPSLHLCLPLPLPSPEWDDINVAARDLLVRVSLSLSLALSLSLTHSLSCSRSLSLSHTHSLSLALPTRLKGSMTCLSGCCLRTLPLPHASPHLHPQLKINHERPVPNAPNDDRGGRHLRTPRVTRSSPWMAVDAPHVN